MAEEKLEEEEHDAALAWERWERETAQGGGLDEEEEEEEERKLRGGSMRLEEDEEGAE